MTKTVDKSFGEGFEGNKIWWRKLWTKYLAKEIKQAKPKDKSCGRNFKQFSEKTIPAREPKQCVGGLQAESVEV